MSDLILKSASNYTIMGTAEEGPIGAKLRVAKEQSILGPTTMFLNKKI